MSPASRKAAKKLREYAEQCEQLASKLDALEAIGIQGGYSAADAHEAVDSARACIDELEHDQLPLDDLYAFVENGEKMPRFDADNYTDTLKGEVIQQLRRTEKSYHAILEAIGA